MTFGVKEGMKPLSYSLRDIPWVSSFKQRGCNQIPSIIRHRMNLRR